jgi:hypothetical protein
MATISRANLYHVPNRQWMKWSPQARGVFNLMYSTVRSNQGLFIHPKAHEAYARAMGHRRMERGVDRS